MAYRKIEKNLPLILLQAIRKNADKDGYATFSGNEFAMDHGVAHETVAKIIRKMQDEGKLEYTRLGKKGLLIHLIQRDPDPRKCPKCGETAHDANSRFCHRCGASLLTEKEQLKYRLDRLLPRLYREIKDPAVANEAMELIGTLKKIVFEEE
jgi:DNA-binding transcriptional regulator YhcF (GntR family)